jgi:nucleoside-triphosphatase
MRSPRKNILITGNPGVGKTTLVKKILSQLEHLNASGFYTQEIREGGIRQGFELEDLSGQRSVLSHVRIKSPYRVGKYGVDVARFDEFLDATDFLDSHTELVVIDEIGKMECYSSKFVSLMRKILDSDTLVIATIAQKGGGFIAEIKERDDIQLYVLTKENRDRFASDILREITI